MTIEFFNLSVCPCFLANKACSSFHIFYICLWLILFWSQEATHTMGWNHLWINIWGSYTNYINKILAFFDHLPPWVDIFYGMNVDKKWTFLDRLPTSSCKRSLWTTPNEKKYLLEKVWLGAVLVLGIFDDHFDAFFLLVG